MFPCRPRSSTCFPNCANGLNLTYIFIAHDLAVVRQVSSRVAVMYLGSLVEIGKTDALYREPRHPYTHALLSAVPQPENRGKRQRIVLEGEIPSPLDPPKGCKFCTRCPLAADRCHSERPKLRDFGDGRQVACHYPLGAAAD